MMNFFIDTSKIIGVIAGSITSLTIIFILIKKVWKRFFVGKIRTKQHEVNENFDMKIQDLKELFLQGFDEVKNKMKCSDKMLEDIAEMQQVQFNATRANMKGTLASLRILEDKESNPVIKQSIEEISKAEEEVEAYIRKKLEIR